MTNPPDNSTVISDLPLAHTLHEGDSILTQRSDKSLVKMPANLLKGQKGDSGAQGPQGDDGKDATAPPLAIFPSYSETPPEGFLFLQGQTFHPENYPILAKKFPSNILPDFRNRVPRGAGDLIALGEVQEDAMQPIVGSIWNLYCNETYHAGNGAYGRQFIYTGGQPAPEGSGGAPFQQYNITIDSSLVTRTASETRVKAIGVNFMIKAS